MSYRFQIQLKNKDLLDFESDFVVLLVVLGIVVEDLDTVVAAAVVDNCNRVGNLALVDCIRTHTGWVVDTHCRVGVGIQNCF